MSFSALRVLAIFFQYMLLRKLVVGLKDPVLKREVFQTHGDYRSVEELRDKCTSFEAAVRDTGYLYHTPGCAVGSEASGV